MTIPLAINTNNNVKIHWITLIILNNNLQKINLHSLLTKINNNLRKNNLLKNILQKKKLLYKDLLIVRLLCDLISKMNHNLYILLL